MAKRFFHRSNAMVLNQFISHIYYTQPLKFCLLWLAGCVCVYVDFLFIFLLFGSFPLPSCSVLSFCFFYACRSYSTNTALRKQMHTRRITHKLDHRTIVRIWYPKKKQRQKLLVSAKKNKKKKNYQWEEHIKTKTRHKSDYFLLSYFVRHKFCFNKYLLVNKFRYIFPDGSHNSQYSVCLECKQIINQIDCI